MKVSNSQRESRWLIIGSEDDPRVQGFQTALHEDKQPAAKVVDLWANCQDELSELLTPDTYLRIESPGSDLNTVRELSKLGTVKAKSAGFQVYSNTELDHAKPESGEFIAPHQFYYGFRQRLNELHDQLIQRPIAASMNHIPDVLRFYDKQACHQYLSRYDISLPSALYNVGNYDDLREKMRQKNLRNVFIKTRFGSGASGIIALKTTNKKIHASTTVEEAQGRLYNTRHLKVIHDEQSLALLVNQLCQWGVHCEAWIPKLSVNQNQCDCRLLIVDGEINFAVLRKSKTPITNLHLLNQRANISELSERLSETNWNAVLNTANRLAGIFPNSFHMALDIAIHNNKHDHYLLEINAFGDFIQNITHLGMTTYQWELERFTRKYDKAST